MCVYFHFHPPLDLMEIYSGRFTGIRGNEMNDEHYSWKQVYDLMGCEADEDDGDG